MLILLDKILFLSVVSGISQVGDGGSLKFSVSTTKKNDLFVYGSVTVVPDIKPLICLTFMDISFSLCSLKPKVRY